MSEVAVKTRVKRSVLSPIKEVIKKKKTVKKRHRLDELFGCFKGQIFYDESIFNFKLEQ